MLDSENTRADGVIKDVQEVKTSLQFSQAHFEDLRAMEKKVDSFESQLQQLSSLCTNSELKDLASKSDSFDNQSRRYILMIDGFTQDNAFEPWPDSEKKVKEFIKDKF